jgi:integrase
MTGKKGRYGSGSVEPSGKNSWRIRYRIEGVRHARIVEGTKTEASRELRRRLHDGDEGKHIAPDKMTVEAWIDHWISIGAPGRRKKKVGHRTLEGYGQKLRTHVKPVVGKKALQELQATDIDKLYAGLEGKVSPTTAHHVHTVFNSCLSAAVRKKLLARNPIDGAEKVPATGKFDHDVLDDTELVKLVEGFKGSPLYPIVAVAVFTGARLREVTALRWTDVDLENRIITVSRAVEETKGYRGTKAPKTENGFRTFMIDDGLTKLLAAHREKQQHLVAGLPDNAEVDLSLIRLPPDALLFPGGDGTDLTKLRDGRAVSRTFKKKMLKLGFPANLRWHDLRGSHETVLLDAGVPVHVVAARCGHDPAELLRTYARRTKKADTAAANVIGTLLAGVLGQK